MIMVHRLLIYLGLTVATAYILSNGSVYAAAPDITAGASSASSGTNSNVTKPLIEQVQKNLMNAKKADESGNLTLAFREADDANWYMNKLMDVYQHLCNSPTAHCFG